MALGFTGIPLPDLLADIRIANLPVCPERVGWWVRRGWMETGVWFVQITLNPNAQLPVEVAMYVAQSGSLYHVDLSRCAVQRPAPLALTWLLWACVISQNHFLLAFLPAMTPLLTYAKKPWMNTYSKIIAFEGNLGCAVMSRSDINVKPKQSLWQKSQ